MRFNVISKETLSHWTVWIFNRFWLVPKAQPFLCQEGKPTESIEACETSALSSFMTAGGGEVCRCGGEIEISVEAGSRDVAFPHLRRGSL